LELDLLEANIVFKNVTIPSELEGAFAVRREVFIGEQSIAEDEEYDGLDQDCLHYVAINGAWVVGTARVRFLSKESAKIERMAVLKNFRRKSVGAGILSLIEKELKTRRIKEAVLHAQMTAVPFYLACGFTATGATFYEAEIEHIKMQKFVGR